MLGILNVHKPPGLTSRDVVNRLGRLVGRKTKLGHAGTLDPLATGVLLVCIGKATKLVPYLHEHLKSYTGTFRLGCQSTTDDVDGQLEQVPIPDNFSKQRLVELLPLFTGHITQVPPAYSAIKINGERAYKAARRGDEIEIPARQVYVDQLDLTHFDSKSFTLTMTCGTGTYVRSIGRDLAQKAGTAAAMSQLVRTSIGPYDISQSLTLERLNRDNIEEYVQPPLTALCHLSRYQISDQEAQRVRCGQRLAFDTTRILASGSSTAFAVVENDRHLVAVAHHRDGSLAPQLVFPQHA